MALWKKVKSFIPPSVKHRTKSIRKAVRYRWREIAIRRPLRRGRFIKIILGAAETSQKGWFATNEQWLDITRADHWRKVFRGKALLTHVVAEHVFEHLTPGEAHLALQQIAQHLVPGGKVRIAVPDGYNPNPDYQAHICIGGIGDDAADHKQVLNADSLSASLQQAGFRTRLVEGYDSQGRLILEPYSIGDGYIWRSRANRGSGSAHPWAFVDSDTSLIVDGVKE